MEAGVSQSQLELHQIEWLVQGPRGGHAQQRSSRDMTTDLAAESLVLRLDHVYESTRRTKCRSGSKMNEGRILIDIGEKE